MKRFAVFSKHALERINQRTLLNYFTIADILDYGGTVDIGTEFFFDKKHWLFYSHLDDCYFIAIQDSFIGTVVTVLPLDYYENLNFKVKDKYLDEAKQKYISYKSIRKESIKEPPSVIVIKAKYISDYGYQKTSTIKKLKSIDYKENIFDFLRDELFESTVSLYCEQKGVDVSKVFLISISHGNNGEPLDIKWKEKDLI